MHSIMSFIFLISEKVNNSINMHKPLYVGLKVPS